MKNIKEKWQTKLQEDIALKQRLNRLNTMGLPATRRGDLLCLKVKESSSFTVHWDGRDISIHERESQKSFCYWEMNKKTFSQVFLTTQSPILLAMNENQHCIKMLSDHHNGSLVLSFLVLLQECLTEEKAP